MGKRKTHKQFLIDLEKVSGEYKSGNLKILGKYKDSNSKILVEDKYGKLLITPNKLLVGRNPTIRSAINKTEYFKNICKDIHNNHYCYEGLIYKTGLDKVKITCPIHGEFHQVATDHRRGKGCPSCARKGGWNYTDWIIKAGKSKNFTGYKIYFLHCWDEKTGEGFYKIGKTFRDLKVRFRKKLDLPYNYKVIDVIQSDDAINICKLEKLYHSKHKEYQYIPDKKFHGRKECYSKLILNERL